MSGKRRGLRTTLLLATAAALSGCSVFSHLRRPTPMPHHVPPTVLEDGYEDFVGVIHIHTQYSDGAGTFEEIARIANTQRLDYLAVTDHNTLRPLREGKQGWYGATLVLVGCELSTRGGHYIALNVTEEIDRNRLDTQQIIDEVKRQGGLGFIAHPFFQKRRWTDWSVRGFTGIEGYNVAHDTLDENRLRLVLWTLSVPVEPFYLSIIDRPYDPLRVWDNLQERHPRVVGIGSSDAHEVRLLGMKFAPYEIMLRLIRTHVLVPSATLTDAGVYDALRKGHAYFSIELVAEAEGFTFLASDGKQVLGIMGDEVPLTPDLRLTTWLPAPAQLILFKDGQQVAATTNQSWEVPITEPGLYRLEAARYGKPWIFSNPIYVRPAPPAPAEAADAAPGSAAVPSTPPITNSAQIPEPPSAVPVAFEPPQDGAAPADQEHAPTHGPLVTETSASSP